MSDGARRRSVDEWLAYEESELREVVEDEAVEFGCGRTLLDDFAGRCGGGKGEGEGGRRSDMPSLCSELRVGI